MLRIALPIVMLGVLLVSSGAEAARDPDAMKDVGRAQERLDRDLQRNAERADKLSARYAEQRSRIEERALREPDKAAEDLAKLDADVARETNKIAEDEAKIEEDFAEETVKEADDAAEALAERGDDSGNRGSSSEMRDIAISEAADHDADGFPVRLGEVVAIDLSEATLAAAQARGFRIVERRSLPGLNREMLRLSAPSGMTSLAARDQLRRVDANAVIDLVHYYGLNLTAGSHGRPVRGGVPSVARPGKLTFGMIDTGVARHAALASSQIVAWAQGNLPAEPVEHGTAVASLLAREGTATIYAANIFRGPVSRPFTSADVIAEAFEWMVANRVIVINMSLAGPRNAILDHIIRDAAARGFQVVAAAGNGGPTAPPAYPAAVAGVIAVMAVDRDLHIYRYANRGRYISVAAHGVGVVAARSAGGYARFQGTSFATPHIAGWMARCRTQGAGAAACRDRLKASVRDLGAAGFDEVYGHGYLE
jgi:subtilisin family serine protease